MSTSSLWAASCSGTKPPLLAQVRVRSRLEQQPHRLAVVRRARGVHGPHAERVVGVVVGIGPCSSRTRTAAAPPRNAARPRRSSKPSGVRSLIAAGSAASSSRTRSARPAAAASRMPSSGSASSSASAAPPLLMEEGEQQHGQAVAVASSGERAVLAQQLAHGVGLAARDGRDECGDARVLAHQRTIPHTRSATSFVKAARRRNSGGLRRDVSEKPTVPASNRTR